MYTYLKTTMYMNLKNTNLQVLEFSIPLYSLRISIYYKGQKLGKMIKTIARPKLGTQITLLLGQILSNDNNH